MYTQCPECESAFRVTADVLKVAAGMVRCGSCGHAFNSLDFLSEDKPQRRAPALPELQPEPDDAGDAPVSRVPKSISAEQSAALLKTLDQLAGEDIRIEDTGVEWRVLDDDDEAVDEEPADKVSESDILKDPELTNAFFVGDVERYSAEQDAKKGADDMPSDETPTVTDLRETNAEENDTHRETQVDIDANVADVFAGGDTAPTGNESFYGTLDEQPVEPNDIFHPSQTYVDEILHSSETPIDAVLDEPHGETPVDAWPAMDEESVAASNAQPEASRPQEELRFDDNTPLPDDFLDSDNDGPVNGYTALENDEARSDAPAAEEEFQASVTLGDPDEWQQLLNEFDGLLSDAEETDSTDAASDDAFEEVAEQASAEEERTPDEESSEDDDWGELADMQVDEQVDETELASRAADMDAAEDSDLHDDSADDAHSEDEDMPELVAESSDEAADLPDWAADGADEDASAQTPAAAVDELEFDDPEQVTDDTDEESDELAAETAEADDEAVDLSSILDPDDDGLVDEGEQDPVRDDSDLPEVLALGDEEGDEDKPEFVIPPQSEEEQTINMLIDQDLLSIAREDEDGFTSTIVYEESENPLAVSSITMQGENLIEEKILQMETGSHHVRMDEAGETAPEESIVIGAASEALPGNRNRAVGFGIVAAVLALGLVLQAVHQRREQLATDPRLFAVLGPVYETLGMPLTPDWDVSQWTIERTQGATDGSDQLLTILSELRNTSSKPMPYPIITVSLTDRYQETIGSLVVGPDTYLDDQSMTAGMVDPGQLVEAEIPIDAPSPETVGYSINACYREDGTKLRCAMADFR